MTATLARTYHAREDGSVEEWFQQRNRRLGRREPGQRPSRISAMPFPTDPENTRVQLRLAEALLADGRFSEARSYLVNLWDRSLPDPAK